MGGDALVGLFSIAPMPGHFSFNAFDVVVGNEMTSFDKLRLMADMMNNETIIF